MTVDSVTWRHYIIGPVVFLHVYVFILTQISLNQYVVYAVHKMRYPNDTSYSNGETTCGTNTSSLAYIHQQKVQEEAALWNIYASTSLSVPAIFSNLVFGTLIDKFGRRLLLISALLGTILKCTAITIGINFDVNIYVFVAFNFFEGISGMWVGTLSASYSYVADITTDGKNRSFVITLVGLVVGIAAFFGSVTSGYTIHSLGYVYTFGISALCTLCGACLVIFLLPETLKKSNHVSIGLVRNIKNAVGFYIKKKSATEGQRWKYILCLSIFTLTLMVMSAFEEIRILYILNYPFCWPSITIGWYNAVAHLAHQIVSLLGIKVLHRFMSEAPIALIGLITTVAMLVYMGVASTELDVYLAAAFGLLSHMVTPMIRGIMSRMTDMETQGSLFAGLAAMEAVCYLVGLVSANSVYKATVAIYRGTVFFSLGIYATLAIIFNIILIIFNKSTYRSEEFTVEIDTNVDEVKSTEKIETYDNSTFDTRL